MGEYWKPLRRKLGVLTLVLACLFTAGWVRSRSVIEGMHVPIHRDPPGALRLYSLISFDGAVYWQVIDDKDPDINRKFETWKSDPITADSYGLLSIPGLNWRSNFLGIGLREYLSPRSDLKILILPYWSIVLPLTALSAWLLLSNRRQPKVTEPSAEPVA